MATAEFWHNLAQQFEQLDPRATLRLNWFQNVATKDRRFTINGDFSTSLIREKFTALAAEAGAGFDPDNPDPTYVWLFQTGKLNGSDVVDPPVSRFNGETGIREYFNTGEITRLAEASAALCYRLETIARQSPLWNSVHYQVPHTTNQNTIKNTTEITRRLIYERYMGGFAEKVSVLDLCWAARQHYRELMRWLQEKSPIKDGAKPDKAFRAVISSGQRPEQYRSDLRPKGWK